MHRTTSSRPARRTHERGYALLTLLLAMSLLVIATGIAASSIAFNIRRDREEELIHRGVQYTRAIREFTKRTGRFPLRLEELDSTNGRRFLRKRYKDPITGEPFKLVYMSEVHTNGIGLTNTPPGMNANPAANRDNPHSPAPQPDPTADPQAQSLSSTDPANLQAATGSATNPIGNDQPVVGGLIVGVVSKSKDQAIRQFSGKNHYDQWRFFYDPAFDQFALMNAPTVRHYFQPPPKLDGATNIGQSVPPPSPSPATQPQPASQ